MLSSSRLKDGSEKRTDDDDDDDDDNHFGRSLFDTGIDEEDEEEDMGWNQQWQNCRWVVKPPVNTERNHQSIIIWLPRDMQLISCDGVRPIRIPLLRKISPCGTVPLECLIMKFGTYRIIWISLDCQIESFTAHNGVLFYVLVVCYNPCSGYVI